MFLFSLIFIFAAESGHGAASGGFSAWWHEHAAPYLSYPGFEAWKFLNLAVFLGLITYLLKKPLSSAFKTKREAIRADLIRAEEEKQAALAKLTQTETRLAHLDAEASDIRRRAESETDAEKTRIAAQTESEIQKLRQQAQSEIELTAKQARQQLRRFSAEESIRLAEEKIRREISPEADAHLVSANIQSIGGLNR